MTMRTISQSTRILDLLRRRGVVSNLELNKIAFRYGARLHDLRNDGFVIETSLRHPITGKVRPGVSWYKFVEDREYGES